ncbi:MAG: ribonuclease HII [Bacteriovoracales bacterium]
MSIKNPKELGIIKKELPHQSFLAGLDEVGRGPLAGPVVAGCSILSWAEFSPKGILKILKKFYKLGVNSSKLISGEKRRQILEHFEIDPSKIEFNKFYSVGLEDNFEFGFSVYEMGPLDIDKINILNASLISMEKAFKKCRKDKMFGEVLIDGNKIPKNLGENLNATAIVEGDSKSLLIAFASIIAKEYRDNLMRKMDLLYPGYNFWKNMGYGTEEHRIAIKKNGITPIHRRSFNGVNPE